MKKRIMILIIAFFALFSGCHSNASSFVVHPTRVQQKNITTLFTNKLGLEVLDWMPLHIGGALVACKGKSDEFPNTSYMEFYLCSTDGKQVESRQVYFHSMGDDGVEVRIFYDEDWETNGISYRSEYIYVTGEAGTDVIVFVTPHTYWEGEIHKTGLSGIEPWDTLETEAMVFPDYAWFSGPTWVFDLSLDDIDDSYELHYADWTLTGTDILNKTWRIGDAPIMK